MKTEKQLNALIYAIERYPEIGRTKLMKFVFFVDLFRFNQTGETLLEDEYIRLPNGPVPDIGFSYTDNSNAYLSVTCEQIGPEHCLYQYKPRKKSDVLLFSEDDIKLFDLIIQTLKKYNTQSVSDLTHRFTLWKEAENSDIITKEKLRLDEYEYDDLESFFYYNQALTDAEGVTEYPNHDNNACDTVSEEMMSLQLESMDRSE